jgi:hypothetical protein
MAFSLRRAVTHTHARSFPLLLQDADGSAHRMSPIVIQRQIRRPFADSVDPTDRQAIAHAA